MTIGIDASRANAIEKTGTEWYSYQVIQQLKKIIPENVSVVLYSKEPLRGDLGKLPVNWRSKQLRWPPVYLWTQLRLSLEQLLHPVHLLYVPAHTIPLVHPEKTVTVIHDVGFERQQNLYNRRSIGQKSFARHLLNLLVTIATLGRYGATELDYHRFSVRHALRSNAEIIAISKFTASELQELFAAKEDRLHIIPNGYNKRIAPGNSKEIVAKLGITKPYIFAVGRLEHKKNTPRLIEAFAELRKTEDIQLVLAGRPGHGYNEVLHSIEANNVRQHVIELGWTSEEQVSACMVHAAVFVLPSLYEGFGIPVLEAMELGVPVVCSDIPPLKEIAADAALFANPESGKSIAEQIHRILTEKQTALELVHKGKKRAAKFSWEQTAFLTWQLIERQLYENESTT